MDSLYLRGSFIGIDGPYKVFTTSKGYKWMELDLEIYSQTSKDITLHSLSMKNSGMRKRPKGEVASWYDPKKNVVILITTFSRRE